MTANRARTRAVRELQAEHGIKYLQALRLWEQQNPDAAARIRDAKEQLRDQTHRPPPTVNIAQFVDELAGTRLDRLNLTSPAGIARGEVRTARAVSEPVVGPAKVTRRGRVVWRIGCDMALTVAGTWQGHFEDARNAPHVDTVDDTTGNATVRPAVARALFVITVHGDPPQIEDAQAHLSWIPQGRS